MAQRLPEGVLLPNLCRDELYKHLGVHGSRLLVQKRTFTRTSFVWQHVWEMCMTVWKQSMLTEFEACSGQEPSMLQVQLNEKRGNAWCNHLEVQNTKGVFEISISYMFDSIFGKGGPIPCGCK